MVDNINPPVPEQANVAPYYDERTQRTIRRFLASMYGYYDDFEAATLKMAGKDKKHPLFRNKLLYFRNVKSALSFIAYRVGTRQKHLLDLTDADIERIESEWQSHSTLSAKAGESPQFVESTTEANDSESPGITSPNSSGENGRESRNRPSKRSSAGRKSRAN